MSLKQDKDIPEMMVYISMHESLSLILDQHSERGVENMMEMNKNANLLSKLVIVALSGEVVLVLSPLLMLLGFGRQSLPLLLLVNPHPLSLILPNSSFLPL